jgi:hypothetical protein
LKLNGVNVDLTANDGSDSSSGFVSSVIEQIYDGGGGAITGAVVASTGMTTVTVRNLRPEGANYGFKYVGGRTTSGLVECCISEINGNSVEARAYIDAGAQSVARNTVHAIGGSSARGVQLVQTPTVKTADTIAFVNSNPDTITDSANGFVAAGFAGGMKLTVSGSGSNDGEYTIATVTAGTITLSGTDVLTGEAEGATVTLTGLGGIADNTIQVQAGGWSTAAIVAPSVSTTVQRNIYNGSSDNIGDPRATGSWSLRKADGVLVRDILSGRSFVWANGVYRPVDRDVVQRELVVNTQFDKAANLTFEAPHELVIDVEAGKTYRFRAILYITADATGGAKIRMSGDCVPSALVYDYRIMDSSATPPAYIAGGRDTALATVITGGAAGVTLEAVINGTVTIGTAGSLAPQFAQSVANGTSSVLVGSTFSVTEIPAP